MNTDILNILKERFESNPHRHPHLSWTRVQESLKDNHIKVLEQMELSGGQPDVISLDDSIVFFDCYKESPKSRTNVCYDQEALINRKKFPPETSAEAMIKEIGSQLIDEDDYRFIQSIEDFDTKTSCWIKTPDEIRSLGGALFGDKRFNHTFIYHNGADSYYGVRGFRTKLIVED